MYRSTFSWPRQKLEVSGQLQAPAALPYGKSTIDQRWSHCREPHEAHPSYITVYTPWERAPSTHSIGGWVEPRVGLDDMDKWKFFSLPNSKSEPSLVQPVTSRYTDCPPPPRLNCAFQYLLRPNIATLLLQLLCVTFVRTVLLNFDLESVTHRHNDAMKA
jgi:hypothetical protein